MNRLAWVPVVMSAFVASCGVSERDKYIGLSPAEVSLAAKVGNDMVPQYADDPVVAANARAALVANHPEWSEEERAAVSAGEIFCGMTRAQVRSAWGMGFLGGIRGVKYANRVRRERWLFDCSPNIAITYFVDDTLVAIRLHDPEGRSIAMMRGERGFPRPQRSEPVLDTEVRHQRAFAIYPQWHDPVANMTEALRIP